MNYKNRWWGYLHTNGNIQVKPVFNNTIEMMLEDARESPFVKKLFPPFECNTRQEAIDIITNKLQQ